MAGFVAGLDRGQATLLPECLEDWVGENNSVRAVDVFVEALDLRDLGFEGVDALKSGQQSTRRSTPQRSASRIWSGVIIHRSNFAFRKQAPLKLQPFIRTSEKTVCEKSVSVQSALKKVADDIWQ
jgi:hypothetical protein